MVTEEPGTTASAWLYALVPWFSRGHSSPETADQPSRERGVARAPERRTCFQEAQALDWPGSRPTAQFFRLLARALRDAPGGPVLVVAGAELPLWAHLVRRERPDLAVVAVDVGADASAMHAQLAVEGPFDVLLQAADTSALVQARVFQRTFLHLRQHGTYLTPRMLPLQAADLEQAAAELAFAESRPALPNEDSVVEPPLVADLWQLVSEAQAARIRDFEGVDTVGPSGRDVRGLGDHLGQVDVFSKALRLRNDKPGHPKLTESETAEVLQARPEIGREVASIPAAVLDARGEYVHNLADDPYFSPRMQAPTLTLRRYDAPTCSRGQVVTSHGLVLADTFRHHLAPRLVNVYVEEEAPRFGRVRRDISEPEELPGAWFHLDSEWPGHFGHFMTEILGRTWAWGLARRMDPDIRPLLTLPHDRGSTSFLPFENALFEAVGIDPAAVHVFDRPCRPEVLFSATSMFSLPDYVHPGMAEVWRRVGDHLAAQAPERDRPRRIFCTRPATLKRACRNTDEVEALFEEQGFTVLRPEQHPLAEQVAMFRAADAVAGFAGSGLFTLALCPEPKQVISVAPTSYTARNEHLIAAIWGHRLVSVWTKPEIHHPHGSWSDEAFQASFTLDWADEGRFLRDQLERLPALELQGR